MQVSARFRDIGVASRFCLFFVLLVGVLGSAQMAPPDVFFCEAWAIPTSLAFDGAPVQIRQFAFGSDRIGESTGDIYVRNRASAPIEALAVLMEYRDGQDSPMGEISYLAATEGAQKTFRPPIRSDYIEDLKAGIAPSGEAKVGGHSYILGRGCPEHARAIFLAVQFAGQKVQVWSTPGWYVGPVLNYLPAEFELPVNLVNPPLNVLTRVGVESAGRISKAVALEEKNAELVPLLQQQMAKWLFFPGLRDGKPSPWGLTVLFRFRSKSEKSYLLEPEEVPSSLVPVLLIEKRPGSGRWFLTYGRMAGGSILEEP